MTLKNGKCKYVIRLTSGIICTVEKRFLFFPNHLPDAMSLQLCSGGNSLLPFL